jgi:hypothetical protein
MLANLLLCIWLVLWPFIVVYFRLYCGHLLLCILGCTVVIYCCVFWGVLWPFIVVYSLGCTVAICCVFCFYCGHLFICIGCHVCIFIYVYWVVRLNIYFFVLGCMFEHLFMCIGCTLDHIFMQTISSI